MDIDIVSSEGSHHSIETNPEISVIMPLYNVQQFVESSITSILNQSYRSFELLILDDQSTDLTLKIVEGFADPRIRIFRSSERLGVAGQLNKGLTKARGKYVARMDGDDWAYPNRFEEQLQFLENHPQVGICGTYYLTINLNGKRLDKMKSYYTNGALKYRSFFRNPFCHPSVMFRKDLIEMIGAYRSVNSEDYDLWIRAFEHTDFYTLPRILLQYRIHPNSVTVAGKSQQEISSLNLRKEHLKKILNDAIDEPYLEFMVNEDFAIPANLEVMIQIYDKFDQRFRQKVNLNDRDIFFINQEWAAVYFRLFLCARDSEVFLRFLKFYFSYPFFDHTAVVYLDKAYSFFYKERMLYAWMFLWLSAVKSPFNGANVVLGFQLAKQSLKRLKFWA